MSEWLVIPLVSAFIGYITNVIAVRMLFRPRQPWRILGIWTVQGLIPKRHVDLARAIGQAIENELLSVDTLLDKLDISSYKSQVLAHVVQHIRLHAKERLPWFVPVTLQDTIVNYLCDLFGKEGGDVLNDVVANLEDHVRARINIRELVENKILELDLAALEQLIVDIAHKELRYIEVLGAVFGLLIGLGQLGLLAILR